MHIQQLLCSDSVNTSILTHIGLTNICCLRDLKNRTWGGQRGDGGITYRFMNQVTRSCVQSSLSSLCFAFSFLVILFCLYFLWLGYVHATKCHLTAVTLPAEKWQVGRYAATCCVVRHASLPKDTLCVGVTLHQLWRKKCIILHLREEDRLNIDSSFSSVSAEHLML